MATKIQGKQIDLTSFDTDSVSEGSSNLYFTEARARGSVSGSGDLNYASATGIFSVTTYKSSNFDTDFGNKDTDDLSEGSSNLFYTEARFNTSFGNKTTTNLIEGTNLYYTEGRVNAALGALTTQTIGANTSEITIGDNLTVTGNLTVSGTTTTINTAEIALEDNVIVINSGQTGTPATGLRSGLEVERGDSDNVLLQFNENTDKWEFSQFDGTNFQLMNLVSVMDFSAGSGLSYNDAGEFGISNDGVTNAHIADGAIDTASKLADGIIVGAKLDANAVKNGKIALQKAAVNGVATPAAATRTVTFAGLASAQTNGIGPSEDCFVFLNGMLLEDCADAGTIGTNGDYKLSDDGNDKDCEIDHDLLTGSGDRIVIKYIATV